MVNRPFLYKKVPYNRFRSYGTSSVAEANDIVESYGVYQPEDVATVNNREREDPTSAASPTPAASAPAGNAAAPQSERYVICPKCGERICL